MKRLKHTKNTVGKGVTVLFTLGMTVIGLACFQILLFPAIWKEDPWFVVDILGIELIVCAGLAYYAIINIRKNELFVCILNEELIECFCPVKDCGESFKLRLDDIERIEKGKWSESHRWYLHDRQGNRYWLTSNYKNPADEIVRRILKLKPNITQTVT